LTPVAFCRLSGLLVPSLLVAVAVSFLTGSDGYGLLAALATAAALLVAGRVRGTTSSCPVPAPPADSRRARAEPEASTTDLPT
jgi:uncharacterized membrane protein (UPF0136 family)